MLGQNGTRPILALRDRPAVASVPNFHAGSRVPDIPHRGYQLIQTIIRNDKIESLARSIAISPRTTALAVPCYGCLCPVRLAHEIKYDGYRLIVQREGAGVHLITRGGYD
jgi:ATP-dependent DNA ligase